VIPADRSDQLVHALVELRYCLPVGYPWTIDGKIEMDPDQRARQVLVHFLRGIRVDQAVADEVLRAIGGNAVEAALEAARKMRQQRQEQRSALELELTQAR